MPTVRLIVSVDALDAPESQANLDRAAAILRAGGTVALPTETVYGLGANALDPAAVARIFEAKQRPAWDPLIVHIVDQAMLRQITASVPEAAEALIAAFWPGPLTLLLPRSPLVPDAVTAGRSLVGVRMPAHPVAREVIRRAGVPVAAPSANRFGHTSPTTAEHVLDDLDGRIDAVLDAGPTAWGVESTVLDPNQSPMILYRPGAITLGQIGAVAGAVEAFAEKPQLAKAPRAALPSPGVGLRHYAPRARLVLFDPEDQQDPLRDLTVEQEFAVEKDRIGLMQLEGGPGGGLVKNWQFAVAFPWGDWSRPQELAHRLFAGLRYLDAMGCTVILCPMPPAAGIGAAMRDRLRKAAWKDDSADSAG
jgi:L-threonylcarbamoyladenylate synthase